MIVQNKGRRGWGVKGLDNVKKNPEDLGRGVFSKATCFPLAGGSILALRIVLQSPPCSMIRLKIVPEDTFPVLTKDTLLPTGWKAWVA